MLNIEFGRIFLEISCIMEAVALTDVCVDKKGRYNVQNESEHRFAFYFILLNAQEQKFDDKFLLQIESLTTQGQYLRTKIFPL